MSASPEMQIIDNAENRVKARIDRMHITAVWLKNKQSREMPAPVGQQ